MKRINEKYFPDSKQTTLENVEQDERSAKSNNSGFFSWCGVFCGTGRQAYQHKEIKESTRNQVTSRQKLWPRLFPSYWKTSVWLIEISKKITSNNTKFRKQFWSSYKTFESTSEMTKKWNFTCVRSICYFRHLLTLHICLAFRKRKKGVNFLTLSWYKICVH